jgi:hypothetical protein
MYDNFGFLGDFVIDYYLERPDVLFNDWLTIGKTILHDFFVCAGFTDDEIPTWLLDEYIPNSSNLNQLAEDRSAAIAGALHDVVQNQGWIKNKREAAIWICKNIRLALMLENWIIAQIEQEKP